MASLNVQHSFGHPPDSKDHLRLPGLSLYLHAQPADVNSERIIVYIAALAVHSLSNICSSLTPYWDFCMNRHSSCALPQSIPEALFYTCLLTAVPYPVLVGSVPAVPKSFTRRSNALILKPGLQLKTVL